MAVVGNLSYVRDRHFKGKLPVIFNYLTEATIEGSVVNKRIFSRPVGAFERVDLESGIFALEQVFLTKERATCFLESHKNYVDFQLNLYGKEQMEWVHIDKMKIKNPYDSEKDLIIFKDSDKTSKFVMEKNDLAIYFPEDVHMGLAKFDNTEKLVFKTVVKVPVEQIERI